MRWFWFIRLCTPAVGEHHATDQTMFLHEVPVSAHRVLALVALRVLAMNIGALRSVMRCDEPGDDYVFALHAVLLSNWRTSSLASTVRPLVSLSNLGIFVRLHDEYVRQRWTGVAECTAVTVHARSEPSFRHEPLRRQLNHRKQAEGCSACVPVRSATPAGRQYSIPFMGDASMQQGVSRRNGARAGHCHEAPERRVRTANRCRACGGSL
jgi:hypothetical protein